MENNRFWFLYAALAAMFVAVCNQAGAKTIYFGTGPELVTVPYGSPVVLRFEEPVKTISNATDFAIKPVSEDAPDYALLSVEARTVTGKSDVTFILASGETAKLRLAVAPRAAKTKVDQVLEVKSQRAVLEARAENAPRVGRMELMTAMIRGDQVSGFDVSKPGIDVTTSIGGTSARLVKVYSGEDFKGYIYELKNKSAKNEYQVDVRKIAFGEPNQAVLAFSDLQTLGTAGSGSDVTRLIVVTKASAYYRDAVLPVRVVKENTKAGGKGED